MKKWMAMAAVAASVLVLAGCQAADVVGKVSVTSFEALLEKSASTVAADEANNGWALTPPAASGSCGAGISALKEYRI